MIAKTQKELAKHLGTTDRTIRDWKAERSGYPSTLDVEAWRSWAVSNGLLNGGGRQAVPATEEGKRLQQIKIARQAVALEREKIELDKLKGKFIELDVIHDVLMGCAGIVRAGGMRLEQSGNKEGSRVFAEVLEQMEREIRERLKASE